MRRPRNRVLLSRASLLLALKPIAPALDFASLLADAPVVPAQDENCDDADNGDHTENRGERFGRGECLINEIAHVRILITTFRMLGEKS